DLQPIYGIDGQEISVVLERKVHGLEGTLSISEFLIDIKAAKSFKRISEVGDMAAAAAYETMIRSREIMADLVIPSLRKQRHDKSPLRPASETGGKPTADNVRYA